MSRESDNPSPTPPRPSGGAYPSGTPPYGMPSDPAFSRAGQPQPQEPAAEEPRTEQTLTTRIRINIPGSRPIPPVVVRSPVGGAQPPEGETPEQAAEVPPPPLPKRRHRGDASGSPVLGVMEGGAGPVTPPDLPPEWQTQNRAQAAPAAPAAAEEDASEPGSAGTWFAPRKKGRPTAPAQAPFEPPLPTRQPQQAQQPPFEPEPQFPSPFEPPQPPATQQAPQEPQQPFPPQFEATPPFEATPDFEATQQFQAPPPQFEAPPQFQPPEQFEAPQQFDPRFEAQFAPQPEAPGYEQPGYEQTEQTALPPQPPAAPAQGYTQYPGFTGGLAAAAEAASGPREPQAADAFEATAALPLFREEAPPARPQAPAAQGGRQAAPGNPQKGGQKNAAKKAQKAQPEAAGGGASPSVPTAAPVPAGYAGGTGGAGAPPRKPGDAEEATGAAPAKGSAKAGPSRGGKARKLMMTGIGALVLIGAVAYGAGLMLNQADVPKGTTVLGYSIGGDTSDTAVNTLNGTVGKLATQPLELSLNGRTIPLDPVKAGLTIDTTATVAAAGHHSYSPVTVIESLFGGTHPVAPVVVVDPDKLRYALQQLSAGSGSAHEGSVHFDQDGTVVTVLPQAGQSLDVSAAVAAVRQAYQARADGVADKPVQLALTSSQPKVSAAAVQSAAATIGKWAMKQHFTVKAGGTEEAFGPITFSKALSLQPGPNGTLVPVFDLTKLAEVYGPTFTGVQIKHNGVLGPITPQDIAGALTQLLSKPGGPTSYSL